MASSSSLSPLDRARGKAYWRLLPILFVCYVIAYIDRTNVSFAKLQMQGDLHGLGFTEAVFGFGMGIFFVGYLLLEIPGSILVERWSARKWICRIMVSWGIIASLTAFVHYRVPGLTPALESVLRGLAGFCEALGRDDWGESLRQSGSVYVFQFWGVRFLLGLAEAGFYPGVIVYLTHWFPRRDRSRALAWFLIATPVSQIIAPPLCEVLMTMGGEGSKFLGLVGWQWVFVFWGFPAVALGIVVLRHLTDRPMQATWLTEEEREALQSELDREKLEQTRGGAHMSVWQALKHPRVLILAGAYFLVVTSNYGVELYMASILQDWYSWDVTKIAWLIVIPPIGSLVGQVFIGWSSDRTNERRWHATLPILLGAVALALAPSSHGKPWMTVALFTLAMTGLKAYLPAFWTLPNLFLTSAAAAASIGLINSFGNLGGWVGPTLLGVVKENTGSFETGLWILSACMFAAALIIAGLGVARDVSGDPEAEAAEARAVEA